MMLLYKDYIQKISFQIFIKYCIFVNFFQRFIKFLFRCSKNKQKYVFLHFIFILKPRIKGSARESSLFFVICFYL